MNLFDVMFNDTIEQPKCANARISAYIIDGSRIVSTGYNSMKTHPFQLKYGKNDQCIHLHAEIDAIKNALKVVSLKELRYCDMYIFRVKRESRIGPFISGLVKPCVGCQRAIVAFGLKNVYYTEDNKKSFVAL